MKRSTILILILGFGAFGLCCLACCIGVLGFGAQAITEQVRSELEDDPRVVQQVGQITSFSINYLASFSNGEDDVYAYDVTGTKWSGRMTIKHVTADDGGEEIVWARFTLPSGEKVELTPQADAEAKTEPEAGEKSESPPASEKPSTPVEPTEQAAP